jgi:hypothetical protein
MAKLKWIVSNMKQKRLRVAINGMGQNDETLVNIVGLYTENRFSTLAHLNV